MWIEATKFTNSDFLGSKIQYIHTVMGSSMEQKSILSKVLKHPYAASSRGMRPRPAVRQSHCACWGTMGKNCSCSFRNDTRCEQLGRSLFPVFQGRGTSHVWLSPGNLTRKVCWVRLLLVSEALAKKGARSSKHLGLAQKHHVGSPKTSPDQQNKSKQNQPSNHWSSDTLAAGGPARPCRRFEV